MQLNVFLKAAIDDDTEDNGSECVICMCDTRDTLILPCRHLCLCNSCADSLRYQANNCPICRAPFRALLQIKAVKKKSGVVVTVPPTIINPAVAPPSPPVDVSCKVVFEKNINTNCMIHFIRVAGWQHSSWLCWCFPDWSTKWTTPSDNSWSSKARRSDWGPCCPGTNIKSQLIIFYQIKIRPLGCWTFESQQGKSVLIKRRIWLCSKRWQRISIRGKSKIYIF